MTFPTHVKIVEVSPRDGLQNVREIIPIHTKIELINQLSNTGLSVIEAGSFVSPKWVPQLANSDRVYQAINKKKGVNYPVLIPNKKGLENALSAGVEEIAVFTTPSEIFSQKNTNRSVASSIQEIADLIQIAKKHQLLVRAYVSCVLGCPYEGEMSPDKVAAISKQLFQLGCYEISLGDTIGVGTPFKTKRLIEIVSSHVPIEHIAVHFHDTYGQALANIYTALSEGVSTIDSSVAGIGGCPYAKGASGNVATEDVIYMLNGMDIITGVDLPKLVQVGRFISKELKITPQSKVNLAFKPV